MKNRTQTEGEVTTIEIVRRSGLVVKTTIDTADLPALVAFGRTWLVKWCRRGRRYYVATKVKCKDVYLHRFLMGSPAGLEIDHIDRDSLNNRRSNLRAVTHEENCLNADRSRCFGRPPRRKASGQEATA